MRHIKCDTSKPIEECDQPDCIAIVADRKYVSKYNARQHALLDGMRALQAMVDEQCDYMFINHLGDPEKQHNIKWARAVFAAFKAAGGRLDG